MKEARIECRCAEYTLSDLKVRVRRGDVVWVSEDAARSSHELRVAVRSGALTVVYTRRCTMHRSPPPPNVRMPRMTRPTRDLGAEPAPAAAAVIDPAALEDAVAKGVAKALEGLLAAGVVVPAQGGRVAASAIPAFLPAPEPVYIPSGLVPIEAQATVTVASTQSESGDMEAAAAALKATRRRKTTPTTP